MTPTRRLFSFLRRTAPDMGGLLLLLVLVAFFFWRLWAPNPKDQVRFPSGDFTEQYYPLRRFVAASLAEGQLPFWNPYIFGGQPGLADPQAAVLYPPAFLNALFHGADLPLEALEFEAVAHIAWAAWGTYLFVRLALRLGMLPGLVASVIFAFGGYLTGFPIQQVTILETLAWLPWLLLTLHYATPFSHWSRKHWSQGYGACLISSALASLVLGCALLAGHPQSAFYLAYLSGFYALMLFVRYGRYLQISRRNASPAQRAPAPLANASPAQTPLHLVGRWLVSGLPLFAPFVLGLLLADAQLQATYHFIDEASRETTTYNFVQNGLRWFELNEILLPKIVDSTPLYVGILPLLLAPLGLISSEQRTQKGFWGAAALITLLLALGGSSILFDLFYLGLPYLDNVRNQERVLIIWNWSMALLSAWGVAALLRVVEDEADRVRISKRIRLRHYVRWAANFIPVLLLPLLVLWWLRALEFAQFEINLEVFHSFFESYSFAFVIFLLSWGLLAWYSYSDSVFSPKGKSNTADPAPTLRQAQGTAPSPSPNTPHASVRWGGERKDSPPHRTLACGVLGEGLGVGAGREMRLFPEHNPNSWRLIGFGTLLLCLLIFDLFSITRAPHIGERADKRLVVHNEVVDLLQTLPDNIPLRVGVVGEPRPRGNEGMYWQIPLLTGNEPLRLAKSIEFFKNNNSWRQFQLLGVQYVVADRDLASEDPNAFELLTSSSGPPSYLLRIRPQMPYAWTVGQVQIRSDRGSLFHRLNLETFDPYAMAFVQKEIPNMEALAGEGASASVALLEHDVGFAQVRVQNPADGPVLLIFAEPDLHGWQLFLDGERSWKGRANLFNVSTLVPPGEHVVTLRYEQPGWEEGVSKSRISLLIILLMLGAGLWLLRNSD